MSDPAGRPDLNPPHRHEDGRALSAEEQRNVAAMERFRDLYNGEDMERFVREAYAPTFHVLNLDGSSWTAGGANRQNLLRDADVFIRAEVFIKSKAPGRRIVVVVGQIGADDEQGFVVAPKPRQHLAHFLRLGIANNKRY